MGRLLRGKQDFQFPHISSYSCSSATTASATPKQFVGKEAKPLFTKYPEFMGQTALESNYIQQVFTKKFIYSSITKYAIYSQIEVISFVIVLKLYICLSKQASIPLFFPLKSYSNSFTVLGFADLSRPEPLPQDLYGVVGLSPIVWLRCHQDSRS